jgi:uncharacterized protein (TIGR01440 family)
MEEPLELEAIRPQVEQILRELVRSGGIKPRELVVIGTSTSEVLGERIGTSGTEAVAKHVFDAVEAVRAEAGFYPVYQCCEHLNRALVLEREAMERYGLEQVSVVPVPRAGGAMASYAYRHLKEPVVVETVAAHAGVDIGGTLIGMHLKRVAVPLRPTIRSIGKAHVQAALTRPKMIGGARAVYEQPDAGDEVDECGPSGRGPTASGPRRW